MQKNKLQYSVKNKLQWGKFLSEIMKARNVIQIYIISVKMANITNDSEQG